MIHSCVTVFFLFPAAQFPHELEPPKFPFPFGQSVQEVAEVMSVKVSRLHLRHSFAPNLSPYSPGIHGKHDDLPSWS